MKKKKVEKIRLRMVCHLCRHLNGRTTECQHKAFRVFPANMKVSELPPDLQFEINFRGPSIPIQFNSESDGHANRK